MIALTPKNGTRQTQRTSLPKVSKKIAVTRRCADRTRTPVLAGPGLENEVTVKRLKRRGGRIELLAENPDYAPIVVNGHLAIEGLMVGLIHDGRTLPR
ncbi:LexA family protein [Candidatus Nitrotoga sp. 1052]|uniref:LexA family protein n=1 Tax=Candidatus Nitrotoga sp. 1052 TaxID=2886964 RepID=UPI001EF6B04C|nr:S24 family peptidase [Candidatus Nitrotoga sp. 1052]